MILRFSTYCILSKSFKRSFIPCVEEDRSIFLEAFEINEISQLEASIIGERKVVNRHIFKVLLGPVVFSILRSVTLQILLDESTSSNWISPDSGKGATEMR